MRKPRFDKLEIRKNSKGQVVSLHSVPANVPGGLQRSKKKRLVEKRKKYMTRCQSHTAKMMGPKPERRK